MARKPLTRSSPNSEELLANAEGGSPYRFSILSAAEAKLRGLVGLAAGRGLAAAFARDLE